MQKLGKLFLVLLVACLLMQHGQPGWARDDCNKIHAQQVKRIRREYAKFANRVNLTTEQRQNLQTIKKATDQQIEALAKAIIKKQLELFQYLFSEGATQARAEQWVQEISQLRNQIALLKVEALLRAREVMTEEQRRQFAAFHQQLMTSLANKYPNCLLPLSNTTLN